MRNINKEAKKRHDRFNAIYCIADEIGKAEEMASGKIKLEICADRFSAELKKANQKQEAIETRLDQAETRIKTLEKDLLCCMSVLGYAKKAQE